MHIKGTHYKTIWLHPEKDTIVQVIDQRCLPHKFIIRDLKTVDDVCNAIQDMCVRGAPLIGAAAAWGMYLSSFEVPADCERDFYFEDVYRKLLQTRPTAINLKYALDVMLLALKGNDSIEESRWHAKKRAQVLCNADVETNMQIGTYGLEVLKKILHQKNNDTLNILTHCNAGWLATVDWGTATSPIYQAHAQGIKLHVYVDETRPRNQGAQLTCWELGEEGISHTLIVDNAGGHLMQNKLIDVVIVGTDRTTTKGDVCNKIGTYLKALAAKENDIPFYVAVPSTSIDWHIKNAFTEIPIEERDGHEIKYVQGLHNNEIKSVLICPENTPVLNYAFDITPAKYITGLITERGLCEANEQAIKNLFPEKF